MYCLSCTRSRFTSVANADASLAAWTADPFFVCFTCSGECNCSGRGRHYYGRVSTRPSGDLSALRFKNPTRTPNELLVSMKAEFEIRAPFPGAEAARFPWPKAGERTLCDISADRIRELKAAHPAVVRSWVAARVATHARPTAAELKIVDKAPTLEGWTSHWGLDARHVDMEKAGGEWEKARDVDAELAP